jgi:beta-galactosidase
MEDLGQSYGYILYRTTLEKGQGGKLVVEGLHDYAEIYLNRKLIGTLDRRLNTDQLTLPVMDSPSTLDILVENSGRVNFTKVIRTERKGITGSVTVGGKAPDSWEIYSLPMGDVSKVDFQNALCDGPCFYRTTMNVDVPEDTYLDTQHLRKGEVWINGRALGRFWYIGPQFALYTPGPWLHPGNNSVVIFDLEGSAAESINSGKDPVFSGTIGIRN